MHDLSMDPEMTKKNLWKISLEKPEQPEQVLYERTEFLSVILLCLA